MSFMFKCARHYSPDTGRFLSEDPIGFNSGDENLYRYVLNNPIKYKDPTGEIWVNVGAAVMAGSISAISGGSASDIVISAGIGFVSAGSGFLAGLAGEALTTLITGEELGTDSDVVPREPPARSPPPRSPPPMRLPPRSPSPRINPNAIDPSIPQIRPEPGPSCGY